MSALCSNRLRQDNEVTDYSPCETGPLAPYINKWYEIADEVEQLHKIRIQASLLPLAYVQQNVELYSQLEDWLTTTKRDYDQKVVEPMQKLLDLQPTYRNIAAKWNGLHDDTNQPWCKNDRYSAPIYSLLDPWSSKMIEAAQDGTLPWELEENALSNFNNCAAVGSDKLCIDHLLPQLNVEPVADVLLDFSQFTIVSAESGALVYPDITIHELRLDLPTITSIANHPDPTTLPNLSDEVDSITTILEDMTFALQQSLSSSGSINSDVNIAADLPKLETYIPKETDTEAFKQQLLGINKLVIEIARPYKQFWDSLSIVNEPTVYDPATDTDKENKQYRTQESALDCKKYSDEVCVHTEFDLLERLTRIFVRPAVLMAEDVEHRGEPRDASVARASTDDPISSCDPADWACQHLQDQHTYPKQQWTFIFPTASGGQQTIIDEYHTKLLEHTLPGLGKPPSGHTTNFPYEASSGDILPLFSKDAVINLIPTPPDDVSEE
jgi:hypothetical protein